MMLHLTPAAVDPYVVPVIDGEEPLDAAEYLARPSQARAVRVDRETPGPGYAGAHSLLLRHAEKVSAAQGVDARATLLEPGRRRMVGGQEDMIVDLALDMAGARG